MGFIEKNLYFVHRIKSIYKIFFRKKQVLKYYKKHQEEAGRYKKELKYLRHRSTHYAQCRSIKDFCKKHAEKLNCIEFDSKKGLWYVLYKNRRMYLKRSMDKKRAKKYFASILFEQERGPHKYLDADFVVEKDSVVLDCGAAEGFFVLSVLDKIKEAYIFECDSEWSEALKATFEQDLNVHIIEKYVSDKKDEVSVALDDMRNLLCNEKVFIKMDIEGAEINAIKGARALIKTCADIKMAVCTYHQQEDEKTIKTLLRNMQIENSEGWLCPLYDNWAIKPPFFRRGVLRIIKVIS